MKNDYFANNLGLIQGIAVGILLSEVVRHYINYHNSSKTNTKDNVTVIGTPHVSSTIDEFKNCLYADYNATTPIFDGKNMKISSFK